MSAGVNAPAHTTLLLRAEFAPTRVWTPLEHEVVNPGDKEAVAWMCQLLTSGQADLYTQDEADLRLLPTITRTWMRRGQQLKLRAPGSPNSKRSVSAATDVGEGVTLWRTDEKRSVCQFALTLIDCANRSNARGRVAALLIDNAPGHRVGKTGMLRQVMTAFRGRVVLIYLPPYSPDLQPEERLWRQWRPQPRGPYSPDAASAGLRALRSTTLDLLVATGAAAEIARAERHYREATNMTDAIAALSILSQLSGPEGQAALEHFYARWQDEPLVLDKCFAVQARAARPNSVETVQDLLSHPKFSLKNPNRIRALLGSFVDGNPTGFNRADGAGYEFLASSALQIDRFNPHMAARLLGAFESWRTLEPRRQALAKSSLRQLASSQLSTDSYEIVTKTLGAD